MIRHCPNCLQDFDCEGDGEKTEPCKDDCANNYWVGWKREASEPYNGVFSMKRFSCYDSSQRKCIIVERNVE